MALVACVSDGQTPVNEPIKSVRISGRVTDLNGAFVTNAVVKIKIPGIAQNTAITQTDENGTFTFPAVVPQQFELFLEAPGFSLLTVPVKAPKGSARIDVGIVVVEVATMVDPIEVAYEPSTLPDSLKSKPGAIKVPNRHGDSEETAASSWQATSCAKVSRGARRIISMNHIEEFYIPANT